MSRGTDSGLAVRRGVVSALWAVLVLGIAALPSRLANVVAGWGPVSTRVERALAGGLLDLAAAVLVLAPFAALFTLLVPMVFRPLRRVGWQAWGGAVVALPLGFALWVLTVTAQEVKNERGSFPTVFDLFEGGTNASFIEGTLGFIGYDRIRAPAVVGVVLVLSVLAVAYRRAPADLVSWRGWSLGFALGLFGSSTALVLTERAVATINRYSPAALGDPLTGLLESAVDLLQHRGPTTARALVLDAELPPESAAQGERLLGWPPGDGGCAPHARPLDAEVEAPRTDPRGGALLSSLREASKALFADGDPRVVVVFASLEGFRADDVHALNPLAPRDVAPFTTSLYELAARGDGGVLAARQMLQAGVRTAHNLGAMTCGIGTLPYNLAFIRDLQPFPVRCTSDVLAEAGFRHSFFYGSDGTFDEMNRFFAEHRYEELVSQKELPPGLPTGTWEAVTDRAVFDFGVGRLEQELARTSAPQFAMLMSLSHHSPFTTPQDLPREVPERVQRALATTEHHADADDTKRLVAFSYTDHAVERLFARLDEKGLSERAIVFLVADHSTGHAYVWGKVATETDAQKAQVPFAIVVPPRFRERLADLASFDEAFRRAQEALGGPVSLNDVPAMVLALLSAHPNVKALPAAQRWHTLGGQVTSPFFKPTGGAAVLSINGVSELFAVDASGERMGDYEDSVFLKTRADRYRVTPRLIPVTAALQQVLRCAPEKADAPR
ncbi:MAG: sulfatase-like hydrolase/transferase [Myxococcaceae bacterium]|nr:sulfatase-like hydrolase/transferase [Myxococcaceae bacterium]